MELSKLSLVFGAQTNLAYNALDLHVKEGWGGHTALIYLNERGERRLFTYANLLHDVEKIAAALRGMGIVKGDHIPLYMPTCPEAIMLMLAIVKHYLRVLPLLIRVAMHPNMETESSLRFHVI
jgi:acyl-coenzyme A synthetase/AMP-(fatty) acid ligase